MSRKLLLAFLGLSLVLATTDADAKGKKKKAASPAKVGSVMTGDPLPSKPVTNPACQDTGALRILGDGPTTPFAMVKKGKLVPAGQECCAQWARKGARYKTLDAFGAVVGEAEITGGEGYDVTQCYELTMGKKKGSMGVGLYVEGDYKAPPSAAWTPNEVEKSSLAKMVSSLEAAMVPNAAWECGKMPPAEPFAKRALYFTVPASDGVGAPSKWAVVGGSLLTLARLQSDGKWVARHVDAFGADGCQHRVYQPRAAFDVDGDGEAEVFVHYDYGDGFGDIVLGRSHMGFEGKWDLRAESVGGSTA